MVLVGDMLKHVDMLITMLGESRLSLGRVREVANKIEKLEWRRNSGVL